MKKILIPTDFSEISTNAIKYGIEIAKTANSKITLLHVMSMPIITTEAQIIVPPLDEMKKECEGLLDKLKKELLVKTNNALEINCVCKIGFSVDEINQFAIENNSDLVVIGMRGAGYLSEKIIGSTTTALMQKCKCPVLAIDAKVKFKPIKKIVLACDYEETNNEAILLPLKEITQLFKSQVYILNVLKESNKKPTVSEAVAGIRLEHSLNGVNHSFHFIQNDDVIEGINEFVAHHKIDMVVMIPRMHSALKNIFKQPHTKKMAFHGVVPLLTLHE
jgi:nucleotide-binding universal stress UspA family protein